MAIGSGLATQIAYGLESTAGTPVATAAFLPVIEESLTQERERMESEAIIAGRRLLDSNHWAGGHITPGGDIGHELYNVGIGKILTGMWGTVSSTTGSGPYTHTWNSIGEPQPLTVQVGVPDIGGTVRPLTHTGTMIESWELSCSAGEFARIGLTVASIREFGVRTVTDGVTTISDATITSATAGFNADDVGKPISGTGIPASTTIASVTSATEAELSQVATASGTGITFTIGIALAVASYPSGLRPFAYHEGSISLAGSSIDVTEFTLSGESGLAVDRRFVGSRYRKQAKESSGHMVEGSITVEWENRTQYDRFIAETNHALVIAFANSAGDSLTLNMNVRLDGTTPEVGGKEILTQEIPIKCNGATDAAAFNAVWVSAVDTTP